MVYCAWFSEAVKGGAPWRRARFILKSGKNPETFDSKPDAPDFAVSDDQNQIAREPVFRVERIPARIDRPRPYF